LMITIGDIQVLSALILDQITSWPDFDNLAALTIDIDTWNHVCYCTAHRIRYGLEEGGHDRPRRQGGPQRLSSDRYGVSTQTLQVNPGLFHDRS
jgi:hypothetical protein